MKKRKISLGKLSLQKDTIAALNKEQQHIAAGGAGTDTCQCPTPPFTGDYYCQASQNQKNTCVNCIRTLVNEKTENLCY